MRRASEGTAGPHLHSVTSLVKSRAGGQLRNVGTRRDAPCHAGDNLPGLAMPLSEPLGAGMCHLRVIAPQYASLIVGNH